MRTLLAKRNVGVLGKNLGVTSPQLALLHSMISLRFFVAGLFVLEDARLGEKSGRRWNRSRLELFPACALDSKPRPNSPELH